LGIDLYIKRAWYEMSHLWTPASFKKFLSPILKADVELAHEAGAKFGYIVTAGAMPLLDLYLEAGVDTLIGVDPHEWDMRVTKEKVGKRICLWGGVNGHLTVETGTEEDVKAEVQAAMDALTPGGGFILSPVDNVREHTLVMKHNVAALIEAWRDLR
jgi:uroporphyrinogen decarboxylase